MGLGKGRDNGGIKCKRKYKRMRKQNLWKVTVKGEKGRKEGKERESAQVRDMHGGYERECKRKE